MMANTRIGRPLGSGLNDEATLQTIDDLLKAEPELSVRAAIIRSNVDDEASIRRLQRKLHQRALGRSGDVTALLAKRFEVGGIGVGGEGWTEVEIPCSDGDRFRVIHVSHYEKASLHLVAGNNLLHLWGAERHPLAHAIRSLPWACDWDDPTYRACCERLGLDPDLNRPQVIYVTKIAGDEALARLCVKDWITNMEAPLECVELRGPGRENQDPLWDIVDDSYAFRERGVGTFDPEKLSQLHRKHADRLEPASIQAAADAKHAFGRIEWLHQTVMQSVHFVSTPSGLGQSYRPFYLGNTDIAPWWSNPNIASPPKRNDLIDRRLLQEMELSSSTLVLSEAELCNYEEGGDRDHWTRFHAAKSSRIKVLLNALMAPDLSMTDRLAEEVVRVAYMGYLARYSGQPIDGETKLSYETRDPIQASKARSPWQNVTGNLRWIWKKLASGPLQADGEYAFASGCMLFLGRGICLMMDDHRVIRIRSEDTPFMYAEKKVRLTVDLVPWGRLGYIPDIGARRFEMIDVDTGEPVDLELSLRILRGAVEACIKNAISRKIDRLVSKSAFRFLLGLVVFLLFLQVAR